MKLYYLVHLFIAALFLEICLANENPLGDSRLEVKDVAADDDTPFGSRQKSVSKLDNERQNSEILKKSADDDTDDVVVAFNAPEAKDSHRSKPIFASHASEIAKENELSSAKDAFWLSFILIFIAEIGDKTFMMSAVLAMRNPRLQIFCASISALGLMTVLSAFLGYALPNLLSKTVTKGLSAILFIIFAFRALMEAIAMDKHKAKEELEEVEKDLKLHEESVKDSKLEAGLKIQTVFSNDNYNDGPHIQPKLPKSFVKRGRFSRDSIYNLATLVVSPISVQCFIMVFLAEWGDRSQISTVALAGSHGLLLVSLGAIFGHSLCTAMAVLGGQMLATKISLKTVTFLSAGIFFVFGILSIFECYENYFVSSEY